MIEKDDRKRQSKMTIKNEHRKMTTENDHRDRPSKMTNENDHRKRPSGCSHLVQQVLLGDEVLLEHVLVEVVGRADAPLHAAAGHLYVAQEKRGAPDWPRAIQILAIGVHLVAGRMRSNPADEKGVGRPGA